MEERRLIREPDRITSLIEKSYVGYPLFLILGMILLLVIFFNYKSIDQILIEHLEIRVLLILLPPVMVYLILLIVKYSFQLNLAYSKIEDIENLFNKLHVYRHGEIDRTVEIAPDGSCRISTMYEFIGVEGIVEERVFRHTSSIGSKLKDLEFDIKPISIPKGKKFKVRNLAKNEERFEISGTFSPGLSKGESAKILLTESLKELYLMTKEQVKKKIRKKEWTFDKPYEFTSFVLIYPTDKLKMKVIFPEGYKINGRNLYDVTVGTGTVRNWGEYGRIRNEGFFSHEKNTKRESISISIDQPAIGHTYWLKWIPEEENHKIQSLRGDKNKIKKSS